MWSRSAALAAAMSAPQETMVAGSPIPRKDRVASATMKTPSSTVAVTMIGAAALGRTWRTRMASRPLPSETEAVMKSSFFTLMTAPRVMRAICGHPNIASTMTTVMTDDRPLNICMTTMAASTKGTAKNTSVMRESSASKNPPKNPASAPMSPPSRVTRSVVSTPTVTEARAPYTVLAKMSQPCWLKPKGCWAVGGP